MRDFLEYVAKMLVQSPDQVEVTETQEDETLVFKLSVAQEDVGRTVYIPEAAAVKLPPGTFFWHQIIGLSVKSTADEDLGQVTEILETGSNDVYVVTGPRGQILIPATAEVVRSIDVEQG